MAKQKFELTWISKENRSKMDPAALEAGVAGKERLMK